MADGRKTPRLQPPPRVRRVDGPDPGGGRSDRPPVSRRRRGTAAAVAVGLALGLMTVFVLLPGWQERREERRGSTAAASQAEPPTAVSTPPTPVPPEPHPTPPATPTLNPVPTLPQPTAADRSYVEAMSDGLEALEGRRWQAATDAFGRASTLRPGASEVADGLARAHSGQRLESIAERIRQAGELEEREAWSDAERAYAAVLALDPEAAKALEGRRRSEMRAALDERIEYHLANPDRLSTSEVFADAASTLEEALEEAPNGGLRLESQTNRLEALLERASTPVAVVLESDAMTDVVVYRIGRQGRFTRRELSLKPGAYTVVGSRDGYRDVRFELVVTPESAPVSLVVRCTEAL